MESNTPIKRTHEILLYTTVLVSLFAISRFSFPLFHAFAEIFSIVVAWSLFLLVWNTRRHSRNDALLFLGISYLFIGFIDLFHTLSYKGMGIYDEKWGANLPTQMWIIGRYLESGALFIFTILPGKKLNPMAIFSGWLLIVTLLFLSVFAFRIFPPCYIEGSGLTSFKVASEYIICLILTGALFNLYKDRNLYENSTFKLLFASIILTILSELAFTFYISVYGLSNLIGHYLKIISFFLLYRVFIRDGIAKPFSNLFTSLQESDFRRKEYMNSSLMGTWWMDVSPAMPTGIPETDRVNWLRENCIITDCNEVFSRMTGNDSVEMLIGKKLTESIPYSEKHFTEIFRSLVSTTSGVINFDTMMVHPDSGKESWFQSSFKPVYKDDMLIHIMGSQFDITKRKRRQEVNDAYLELIEFSEDKTVHELLQRFLDEAERLTESKIGFFHFLEKDQKTLSLQAWSTNTMTTMCSLKETQQQHYSISEAGVWVDCVTERKPTIHNDYESLKNKKGLPRGHAPIIRELVVPVIRGKSIVAILGVGNKTTLYDDEDIETVQKFADAAWETVVRLRAEEQLKKSLENLEQQVTARTRELNRKVRELEAIFETSRVGLVVLSESRIIQKANKRFAEIFGYDTPAEVQGKSTADFYPTPEQFEEFGSKYRSLLQKGEILEIEQPVKKKDGTLIWCSVSGQSLNFENPQDLSQGFMWVVDDITKRVEAEKKLQVVSQKLQNAHNLGKSGWWEFDVLNDTVNWPKETYEIYGLDPDTELDYTTLLNLMHDEYHAYHNEQMELILKNGKAEFAYPITRPDGKQAWIWALGQAEFNDKGEPVKLFGTLQDVTQQKMAEAELIEAREQAEAANLAKSTFLSNMSHELRTPLNAILGYTQIFANDEQLNEQQRSGINTIHLAGEHLLMLINDILDMSKIESGKLELVIHEVALEPFLKNIIEFFSYRARQKGIEFRFEPDRDLPDVVLLDELRLRQVLFNLLSNAIKFTARGYCSFGVQIESKRDDHCALTFTVEDSGIGISKEDQESIFAPFQQVGDRLHHSEGSGLGLAISKELVGLMSGSIEVESPVIDIANGDSQKFGPGSRFSFTINVEITSILSMPSQDSKRIVSGYVFNTARTDPLRALIVDDKLSNRDVLRDTLSPLGFELRETDNGHSVAAISMEFSPDIIFMDLRMPKCDGFSALTQVRSHTELMEIPIIAVTASTAEEKSLAARCFAHGFNALVCKPFQISTLLEEVEKLLPITLHYKDTIPAEAVGNHISTITDFPSLEVMEHFVNLLGKGDLDGIIKLANTIEGRESGKWDAFCLKVKTLADNFQLTDLEELFSSNIGDGK